MKKAIIAVSYGTSYSEALSASVETTEDAFRLAFPEFTVRRAFTGKRIREMLAKKGVTVDSVEEALEKLVPEGYHTLILQPTHIISGNEYDKIKEAAEAYKGRFAVIETGAPLLHDRSDIETICRFFADTYGNTSDALLLMGHGSDHFANKLYSDFAEVCKERGYVNQFIATLEASPCLEDIIPQLKMAGYRSVTITPLLFVAGGHACKDMAGDHPESWKSKLDAEGFSVNAIVKGLGEYAPIRSLYVKHLRDTIEKLS